MSIERAVPAPDPEQAEAEAAELEARAQDRAERRLFWRQLALVVAIATVVALRLWLV